MLTHEENIENLQETLKIWELAKDFYHDSIYEAKRGAIKTLHSKNIHNTRYDFQALCKTNPNLKPFVDLNQYHF